MIQSTTIKEIHRNVLSRSGLFEPPGEWLFRVTRETEEVICMKTSIYHIKDDRYFCVCETHTSTWKWINISSCNSLIGILIRFRYSFDLFSQAKVKALNLWEVNEAHVNQHLELDSVKACSREAVKERQASAELEIACLWIACSIGFR